jgi:peptidoglycan hydrolase-like protein with peptidoglycan-binding domain
VSYYGLGTLPAVTSVATNTRSTAVRTLQAKLSALGFLPASGIDGFFGPQTISALGAAARSVGYTGETVTRALVGSTYHYTVPVAALNAIDAAVATAGSATSPSTMADPTLVGPGDQAVLDQAAADEAATSTSPSGTPDYKLYVAVGVGALALIAGVVYLSKKPAAPSAAVKANRRRRMRRNFFGAGSGRYELRGDSGKLYKRADAGYVQLARDLAESKDEGITVIDTQTGEEKDYFGAPMRSNRRRVRKNRRRAA